MNRKWLGKWIGMVSLVVAGVWLLNLSSCARSQQLTGITVSPSSFTFLTPSKALVTNYTAIGTFIHPPESKDITALVTWNVDFQGMVTINAGAVSPTGTECGVANISASYDKGTGPNGAIVIGYATVTVDNPAIAVCPGGSAAPILTVQLQKVTSSGDSVTSIPPGINCPAQTCGAPFTSGTTVSLSAAPSANFVSWGAPCTGSSATTCDVTVTANTTVVANFQ